MQGNLMLTNLDKRHDVIERTLVVLWLASLAGRVLIFNEGGTVGAYATVLVFWGSTLGLLLYVGWQYLAGNQSGWTRPVLGAVVLAAFLVRVVDGPAASIASVVFFGGLLALVILYARSVLARRRSRRLPSPG